MPLSDNDATRMTRAQLADRIRQMEATARRNCTVGALHDRHHPMEDRKRREKIARYQDELDRRTRADEAQAATDARVCPQCEGTGSISVNGTAYGCSYCDHSGLRPADPEDTMPHPKSRYDDYADAPPSAQEWQEREEAQDRATDARDRRAATATEYPPMPPAAAEAVRAAAEDRRSTVTAIRATTEASIITEHTSGPVVHPPAEPTRRRTRKAAPRPEPTPATQTPTAAATPTKAERLATAIRALLQEHTSGDIIDAAWEESGKIFRATQAFIGERRK